MADETKLMRIVEMRERLQQGARLTIERLCEDYKVDRRTVTRDFNTLEALGMELATERLDDGRKVWYVTSRSRRVDVQYSMPASPALSRPRSIQRAASSGSWSKGTQLILNANVGCAWFCSVKSRKYARAAE
jgi:predicted DNA-binding transcriptional regulator YafY